MERKGFIGGSDTVQIMQDKWQELWMIKTGREEPENLSHNLAVQMGSFTEDFNIRWFSEQHSMDVIGQQKEFKSDIHGVPTKGMVDGLVVGESAILECKHTNAFNTMDNVTDYYMPQIQTYIYLAGVEGAWLSVFFGNNKWESVHISRNAEYFDAMWSLVEDFWGYVKSDIPPNKIIVRPTVSTDKIPVNDMVRRDASNENEFVSLAHDFLEHEAASKSFESAKKDLKLMVGDNEREVYVPGLLAIKRSANRSLRFTKLEKD